MTCVTASSLGQKAIMNLLSIAAALGALNAVFNLGWGAPLLGLTVKSPIDAFIPVLMFSVLFGLSTDYEVYLVSRIREEWQRLQHIPDHQADPRESVAVRRNHQATRPVRQRAARSSPARQSSWSWSSDRSSSATATSPTAQDRNRSRSR
jgi:uncharacterized membrane protein YdfJ with MMPL/SSD domain